MRFQKHPYLARLSPTTKVEFLQRREALRPAGILATLGNVASPGEPLPVAAEAITFNGSDAQQFRCRERRWQLCVRAIIASNNDCSNEPDDSGRMVGNPEVILGQILLI